MDRSRRPGLVPPWLGPVCVAGSLYLVFVALYLVPYHGDLSALVCAPQKWIGHRPFEAVNSFLSADGYDGAYYYVIAQNPFEISLPYIDAPSIRHGRLLYPLLSWLASGGDAYRLLWVMPLLNFIAILGLTWLGTKIAEHQGRSSWWGLLLPIAINAYLPALRDLTDTLAALAAVGLLASWLLRWPTWLMIGWGIASVMSREQNAAIVMIVGLGTLLERDGRRATGIALVIVTWAGWLFVLKSLYGELPVAGQNVAGPFKGLSFAWTHLERPSGGISPQRLLKIAALTCLLLSAPIVIFRGSLTAKMVTLAGACLALVSGIAIFEDPWSYTRVLNWLPLGVWLYGVQEARRWPIALLAPAALWPPLEVFFAFRGNGLIG